MSAANCNGPSLHELVRADCLRIANRQTLVHAASAPPFAALIVALVWNRAPQGNLLAWLGAMVAASIGFAVVGFGSLAALGSRRARLWDLAELVVYACWGSLWGVATFVFTDGVVDPARAEIYLTVIVFLIGANSTNLVANASHRPYFLAGVIPIALGPGLYGYYSGRRHDVLLGTGAIAFGALTAVYHYVAHRFIQRSIGLRHRFEETMNQIDELSRRDDLTGAYNRRHFLEELDAAIAGERHGPAGAPEHDDVAEQSKQDRHRPDHPSSRHGDQRRRNREHGADLQLFVAIVDLDHFKSVNDTFGHAAGDDVLRALARVATAGLRPPDCFARLGGEEFGLLLHAPDVAAASAVVERMRTTLAETELLPDRRVTLSAGLAWCQPGDQASRILGAADRALYEAKEAGRNRLRVADAAATDPAPAVARNEPAPAPLLPARPQPVAASAHVEDR